MDAETAKCGNAGTDSEGRGPSTDQGNQEGMYAGALGCQWIKGASVGYPLRQGGRKGGLFPDPVPYVPSPAMGAGGGGDVRLCPHTQGHTWGGGGSAEKGEGAALPRQAGTGTGAAAGKTSRG